MTCTGCGRDRLDCLPCPDCGRMVCRDCRFPNLLCKDEDGCKEAQGYDLDKLRKNQKRRTCPDCGSGAFPHGEGFETCSVCGCSVPIDAVV